jgi:hypothetical protein
MVRSSTGVMTVSSTIVLPLGNEICIASPDASSATCVAANLSVPLTVTEDVASASEVVLV